MTGSFTRSEKIYEAARKLVPAGVNSNTRARAPFPFYFARASGGELTDVDGNRFLDIVMGNGAVMLGHNHPAVQEAVRAALDRGLTAGVETEGGLQLAEKFLSIVSTQDMVRFTNTGTEAVMHAFRLARHATGRKRIAKIEGSYHGWSDEAFISCWPDLSRAGPSDDIRPLAGTLGQRADLVAETVILPFNDIANSVAAIERNASELAAVILEPILIDVGFIPATTAYLQALRKTCDKYGIVLIFDELLTGFNASPRGVQASLGVIPDLSTFGKALGNGYPIAALAGRESLMRQLAPGAGPAFVGTFNGHAVSLAAAVASLDALKDGSVQATLDQRTKTLARQFEAAAEKRGLAAAMPSGGSHFHWYFTAQPITDFRSAATSDARAYRAFVGALAERNTLYLPNPLSHHAISFGHSEANLAELADIFEHGLDAAARAVN